MQVLSSVELERLCHDSPGWELVAGELVRSYVFTDFKQAIRFVDRVAALAEQLGHHPDIDIRYTRVRLALMTHDAGGITHKDANMIEALAGLSSS